MPAFKLIPNDYILRKHPDVSWREWLGMAWNDIEWPVVLFLGIMSLTLGIVGFLQYPSPDGTPRSFWDSMYGSLQLFSMQAEFASSALLPFSLQIARFFSPTLAAYALFQAFMVVFKEQLELFRLVRTTNHFIICGLGEKGFLLTKDLRKRNHRVVIIEQNGNNPRLEICRELGAIAIVGDARDGKILVKAGIREAKHIIAVCGEDGTNVDIAGQAETLLQRKQGRITPCTIHITDPYLWTILREREFVKAQISPVRVEMFNIYDTGARALLHEALNLSDDSRPPHLLIIGMGNFAEYLIIHAAREWCLLDKHLEQKLKITLVDPLVKDKLANLQVRFPLLTKTCEFNPQKHSTNWPKLQDTIFSLETNQENPVTNAFICLDDSSFGLQVGFTLLQLLEDHGKELMVRMAEDSGLASFLRETKNPGFKNLSAFGLLESTCKIELLDDGAHETLARIIHEDYVEREKEKGLTVEQNPSMIAWESLPDELKEANRRQADHIGIKLAALGYGIKPWREYGGEKFKFKNEEIFKLAKMEHKRWRDEKDQEGWKYGEKRDDIKKIHPDLVNWESLSEDEKRKDIETVKLIPNLLARAGFQIYKLHG